MCKLGQQQQISKDLNVLWQKYLRQRMNHDDIFEAFNDCSVQVQQSVACVKLEHTLQIKVCPSFEINRLDALSLKSIAWMHCL